MTFYIDTVAIDYISLTTYAHFDFISIASALEDEYDGGLHKAQRMQYAGTEYKGESGGIFWGIGLIGEREHHIIQASGMLSQRVAEICHEWGFSRMSQRDEWTCKRLDIQLTIEHDRLDAWKLRKAVGGGLWPKRIPRKLTLISSETDTLYIGSRSSGVMFRVYQKSTKHVRLELEMKKEVSKQAWEYYLSNCNDSIGIKDASRRILYHELRNIPDVSYLRHYRRKLGSLNGIDVSTGERHKSDDSKRFKWFVSLIPTITRMCNDSDTGWKVKSILKDILENTKKS